MNIQCICIVLCSMTKPIMCLIGEMSINDFRRLKEVLVELHRIDLKKKVEEFEKKVGATRRIPLHSAIKQSMLIVYLYNFLPCVINPVHVCG